LAAGTRIESFKSGKHGISAYASKYAAKQAQKDVPVGFGDPGRFWGVAGMRATMSADTFVPVEVSGMRAVERQINTINALVNDGIEAGKVRKIETVEGSHVYYIKSLALMAKLTWAVEHLQHIVVTAMPWSCAPDFIQDFATDDT
jgi:hypothetical protein